MYTKAMSTILFHAITFFGAGFVIVFFGGMLIDATDQIAKYFRKDGFLVAFLLLGTLTSMGEASVMINSTVERVPQISAGNLIGASFVIFLCIIPLLAFFGKGITLKHGFAGRYLLLALVVIGSPALFMFDGSLTRKEGLVMLVLYGLLLYYTKQNYIEDVSVITKRAPKGSPLLASGKIVVSAILIFMSGKLLVDEAVYFSHLLTIPASFIGLVLIAIGTNVPELVIAFRAIAKRRKSIAFGDYVGSAAFNTFLLSLLVLINGAFLIERSQFLLTSLFLTFGLTLFFMFARSKNTISPLEGALLGLVYFVFIAVQLVNVVALTAKV